MVKIEFDTENAAFGQGSRLSETARILRDIAEKIENGSSLGGGPVRDINGNTVGHWEMTPYGNSSPDHD